MDNDKYRYTTRLTHKQAKALVKKFPVLKQAPTTLEHLISGRIQAFPSGDIFARDWEFRLRNFGSIATPGVGLHTEGYFSTHPNHKEW